MLQIMTLENPLQLLCVSTSTANSSNTKVISQDCLVETNFIQVENSQKRIVCGLMCDISISNKIVSFQDVQT